MEIDQDIRKVGDEYLHHMEWEIIDSKEQITNLKFENEVYKINQDCLIQFSRDEQYNLSGKIYGVVENEKELNSKGKEIAGSFVEDEIISGVSYNGLFEFKLYGIFLNKLSMTPNSYLNGSLRFKANLHLDTIEKTFRGKYEEPSVVREWYITGKTDLIFPRRTVRNFENSRNRERSDVNVVEREQPKMNGSSSWDYFFVEAEQFSFVVAEVPEGFGPKWSWNLCIEYRKSFGSIPDEQSRDAVNELVGFLLGNQLLKVGCSFYDNNENLFYQKYQKPWGDGVINRCERIGLPPVHIAKNYNRGKIEKLVKQLLPNYLKLRTSLRINDVLWKFWIANHSALGSNLPILSSGIETLANAALDFFQTKTYDIDYKEFNIKIADEIAAIEEKLKGTPHQERIIKKIRSASQRGSNEKFTMLLETLDLKIGKIEKMAINARHKMAHSSPGGIDWSELENMVRLTRAYQTLFHRILLKTLGYKEDYIDYYTFGHPNRNINEPIPESKAVSST